MADRSMESTRRGDEEFVQTHLAVIKAFMFPPDALLITDQPAIQAELASNIAHSQSLDLVKLLAFLARDPSLSLAFNYASLILNNSFFLQNMVRADFIDVPVNESVTDRYVSLILHRVQLLKRSQRDSHISTLTWSVKPEEPSDLVGYG